MPKAKNTALSSPFFRTGPLKTGAMILLFLSLLTNLGVLLYYVLLNHTPHFNDQLFDYTMNKICITDYADLSESDQKAYAGFCK